MMTRDPSSMEHDKCNAKKKLNIILLSALLPFLLVSCYMTTFGYYSDIATGSKTRLDNIIQDIIATKYKMKSQIDDNSNDTDKMIYDASWARKLTVEAKGICTNSGHNEECFARYKDMVKCSSEIHLPLAEYLLKRGYSDKARGVYDDFVKIYRDDEYASIADVKTALAGLENLGK